MFYPLETSEGSSLTEPFQGLKSLCCFWSCFLIIHSVVLCVLLLCCCNWLRAKQQNRFVFQELKANIQHSSMLSIGFYKDIIWHSSSSWWKCSFSSRDSQMCSKYAAKICSNSIHNYWILGKYFVLLVGTWMK